MNNISSVTSLKQLQSKLFISSQYKQQCQHLGIILNGAIIVQILKDTSHNSYSLSDKTNFMKQILILIEKYMLNIIVLSEQSEFIIMLVRNIIINIKNLNDMRQNIKDQENKNKNPIKENILNQKKLNHQNNIKQQNNNEQQQNDNKIKNEFQLNNNLIEKDKIFSHNNIVQQQQQKINKQFIKNRKLYISILIEIFQIICKLYPINNRQLQIITTFLSDCHYQNTLSSDLFQNSYLMLSSAFKKYTITPFVYFNQPNQHYGIKVLLNNNKWMFNKGMTLWLWINISFVTECIILNLKTQDGKQLILKYNQKSELIGEVTHGIDSNKFQQSIVIGLLPLSTTFLLGIQLFLEQGIMKSTFKLNIAINSQLNHNIALNIPKFNSSQLITQFLFLNNFVGTLHSIIIQNKSELNQYIKIRQWSQYGPNCEELVWKLIASSLLKNDTIVAIYNSQRNYQALLLNYVSDKNHCCFNSKICNYKSKPINGQFLFDVHIGILYLLSIYIKIIIQLYIQKNKNKIIQIIFQQKQFFNYYIFVINIKIKLVKIFYLFYILYNQVNIIFNNQYQHIYNNYVKILKIIMQYFLLSRQLNLIIKYLDLHLLMKQKLQIKYQYNIDVNPIHKIQLLFYLETNWIQKWNEIQSFKGWYSPSTFIKQINQPYNSQNYQFHQSSLALYQWSIRNFITNDYCKIMLEPIFKMPKLQQYGQLYRTKSCMLEPFGVNLNHQFSRTKIISHKVKKSRFNRLKEKVFGNNRKQSVIQKSTIPEKKQQIREQVRFECIKIELLSLVEGIVSVDSDGFITFTSKHGNQSFNHMCVKPFTNERLIFIAYHYNDVLFMRKRRFNQSNNCLQLRAKNGTMILLYFITGKIDKFMAIFQGLIQNRKISYEYYMKSNCTLDWIDKKMSNYQYLQWLNEISGRSYNDITQYPIMPWVYITNLPTQNKNQYRDFTKNMGNHGDQDRIFHFLHKFNSYNESQLFNQYHFGTHYSSSAIIINYMIRLQPFTSGSIALQSGKFDCADRIFYSYIGSWINATTSPTDIRQLIPEFYTIPEMFFNINNNNYGVTQTNEQIDNVQMPKWCSQGNPYEFVIGLRRQLESSAVSKQINHWIDLIYGYKQRGPLAISSMNIFFPLTYQNSIDLSKIDQLDSKLSYQTQIAHFGQNPCQIIEFNPHPQKTKITSVWEYRLITDGNQLTIQRCSIKKNNIKTDKTIFKSQFQSKHSVLNLKFIDEANFIVLQKYQYCLFHILENTDFISRQKQIDFQLQNCQVSLNYQQLQRQVPMVIVGPNLGLVGGFYFGYLHLLFINEPQFNQSEKMPMDTITAMDYSEQLKMLFLGDCLGRLQVYIITVQAKYVEFEECGSWIAHDSRINCINMNAKANMFVSCGRDGIINLYNAYSHELYHKFSSPNYSAVDVCCLSICPLYSVIFHSISLSMTYSYSINGQYLSKLQDSSKGQLIGMKSMCSSINIDSMIYVNAVRQLCICETPILKIKRKIKLRKDEYQITSVQIGKKMCIVANQNGDIFIVSTPKT